MVMCRCGWGGSSLLVARGASGVTMALLPCWIWRPLMGVPTGVDQKSSGCRCVASMHGRWSPWSGQSSLPPLLSLCWAASDASFIRCVLSQSTLRRCAVGFDTKAPFLTLRVATPWGAPCEALLELSSSFHAQFDGATGVPDNGNECLRETEVQRRRGTTSPDPEKKNPEPLRGPLGGFLVGVPREEEIAPKSNTRGGNFPPRGSRRRKLPPLVLHLRSSSRMEVLEAPCPSLLAPLASPCFVLCLIGVDIDWVLDCQGTRYRWRDDNKNKICAFEGGGNGGREENRPETLFLMGNATTIEFWNCKFSNREISSSLRGLLGRAGIICIVRWNLRQVMFQRNPRAHKNKIGTSPPPQKKKPNTPTPLKTRNLMGMSVFLQKERNLRAPIKLAQPFPAPESRAKNLRTRGFFRRLFQGEHA